MIKKFSLALTISLTLIALPVFSYAPRMNAGAPGVNGVRPGINPGGPRQPYQRNANPALKADGLNTYQNQQSRQQFDRNRTIKRQQRMNNEQQQDNTQSSSVL